MDLTRRNLLKGVAAAPLLTLGQRGSFAASVLPKNTLIDARTLPDKLEIIGDTVVIGGGPAGIAIALRLADKGQKVVLLESGGMDIDAENQALYEGENVGVPYFPLDITRLRMLGGCTNHWGNQISTFEPIDFARRDWVPHSGWPITRDDLTPYYVQATSFLDLGTFDFDQPGNWDDPARNFKVLDTKDHTLQSKLFRRRNPVLHAGEFYKPTMERNDNLSAFLHANVTNIQLSQDGQSVAGLDVRTLDGKSFTATGRNYVLACGGMENPRILLYSNNVAPGGIGNTNDLVGRYFMDHLRIESGAVIPAPGVSFDLYHDLMAAATDRSACFYLSPAAQEAAKTTVYRLKFQPRKLGATTSGFGGLMDAVRDARRLDLSDMGSNLARMVVDSEGLVEGTVGAALDRRYLVCVNVIEQSPNPNSRVQLGTERDALGLPRIRLDWQLSDVERTSLHAAQKVVAAAMQQYGLGELRTDLFDAGDNWTGVEKRANATGALTAFEAGHHHTGTTRMAEDARSGVVDSNCKVFGVANLYVAGSSTFPTLGSANPTFTIVALALRLADHLSTQA